MMNTTIEQVENIELLPPLPPQHEGYIALRQQGYNPSQAAVSVGYDRSHSNRIEKKYNKYLISGNNKLLKLAHTNVKNMLAEDSQTKDSSRVALVNMIYDRHDPVIRQSVNLNINADISPVDLDKYRNR